MKRRVVVTGAGMITPVGNSAKETWQANDKVELWVGNAAALDLDLNGRPLGSPGRGVIKNILVTHEGLHKESK